MKPFRRPSRKLSRLSLSRCAVYIALCVSPVAAQPAPSTGASDDARTLVRYDVNKNGRLDPDELAAMRADEARAPTSATASAGTSGETIVELTPFEVSATGDKGYLASSTMSGTRLNSRIEDL